jgi:RNA polymerase sigma-70 factor (ECF subfamily)
VLSKSNADQLWARLLAEQVTRNGRLMFRTAFGILRDAGAAEDVCQEALLRAWERRGSVADPTALGGWLVQVVVNESLRVARRRKVERRDLTERSRRATGAATASVEAGLRDSVIAALEKIPELPRLVVALRLMQGLSGNEVKDLLGCSASEFSRQLHRGMERLRELLADFEVDVR